VMCALGVMAWAAGCPTARADDEHVGWIENIRCESQWRANENGEVRKLETKRDRYRFLYPGEWVRCVGTGSIEVQVLESKRVVSKADGWCKILSERILCEKEKGTSHGAEETRASRNPSDEQALKRF